MIGAELQTTAKPVKWWFGPRRQPFEITAPRDWGPVEDQILSRLAIIANFDKVALEILGALIVPTRNINLTDHYHEFVDIQVRSGRYKNASEVMRAGLRLLESETAEQVEKLTVLKRLANEGFDDLDQGRGTQLENQKSVSAFVSEIGKQARKRASS